MIFFLGSVQLVPAVALMFFAIAGALVLAAWSALFTPTSSPAAVSLAVLTVVVAATVLLETFARRRERRRSTPRDASEVGGKAVGLARLTRAGLSTPPWFALDVESCAALLEQDARPGVALRRFLRRQRGAAVIVRSSFPGEDGTLTWAGVFESVPDVDPSDHAAVLAAVRRVAESAQGPAAAAYAARHGSPAPVRPAVVVQRQVEATTRGLALSRGLDGRQDHLVIDATAVGEPTTTLHYDLLTDSPTDRPAEAWQRELVAGTLELEDALGSAVQVEFALDAQQRLWWLQVRPLALPAPRESWVNGGPVELRPLPDDAEVRDQRGGLDALARLLDVSARGVGITEADLRVFDGVPYLSVAALRRIRVRAPAAGVRDVATALFGPIPSGSDPLGAARAQARITAWIAVLDGLAEALRTEAHASRPLPLVDVPGRLGARVARRRTRLGAARDALHELLAELEGASGPVAGFPARVHVPPLQDTPSAAPDRLVGRGLVGGRAAGPIRLSGQAPAPGSGVFVLVAPDGAPERTPELAGAAALVLLGGGALSHLATTALELSVPTVLCPGAELPWPTSATLWVDGDRGTVTEADP